MTIQRRCEAILEACAELSHDGRCVRIMEVCGTHTMNVARNGLGTLLPDRLELISGPGCPVCVTDQSYIDAALHLASEQRPGPIVATYGDMVHVPGLRGSLGRARAAGARVEVVYGADGAVEIAKNRPADEVVFLAVGFETTAPGTALALQEARRAGLKNFSVLAAHKVIPPAMLALLERDDVRIDGFLCPGHVSVILGWEAYEEIAASGRPCVVAGFDAGQIFAGIAAIVRQLAEGKPRACSVYPPVSKGGNKRAQDLLAEVFVAEDARWRGLGVIPRSGLGLRPEFAEFDASKRFDLPEAPAREMPGCRCGDVICGRIRPRECALFAESCTPRRPVGPCMVSSEGACTAAYRYGSKAGKDDDER